jgi:4-alpha-glucanotransferase
MSTKILVDNIRYRFDHNESKLYLKEKYTNKLSIAHAGGMWQITPTLLAFLAHPTNDTPYEYMVDMYNNPIKVDRQELLEIATTTYNNTLSQWHEEYTVLKDKR